MSREELRVEIASRALGLGGEFFHNYGNGCDGPVSIARVCFDIADQFMAALPPMDDGGLMDDLIRWFIRSSWQGSITDGVVLHDAIESALTRRQT